MWGLSRTSSRELIRKANEISIGSGCESYDAIPDHIKPNFHEVSRMFKDFQKGDFVQASAMKEYMDARIVSALCNQKTMDVLHKNALRFENIHLEQRSMVQEFLERLRNKIARS